MHRSGATRLQQPHVQAFDFTGSNQLYRAAPVEFTNHQRV